jgi:hypothetical protein
MSEFRVTRTRLATVAGFYALGGMAVLIYVLQLQYTNSYAGFLPLNFSMFKIAITLFLGGAIGLTIPSNASRPLDMFVVIYAIFVLVSFVFFRGVATDVGNGEYLFQVGLLSLPYAGALLLQRARWSLEIPFAVKPQLLLAVAIAIIVLAAAIAVVGVGDVGGLSINDAYERRMVGREIFQAGSLLSYLVAMAMNGLNPFLAFWAGLLNRKWLFALSALFGLLFFYSLGVKAPMAIVVLSLIVGTLARRGRIGGVFMAIVCICAALFAVFLVEYVVTGYSQVAEYFFRRAFVIPGFLVQYFMTFMLDSHGFFWSGWNGLNDNMPVTYVIGDIFLGNAQTNANTNAFVYALADGGYPAYVAIMVLVLTFFKVLDALYESTENPGYLYIAFLYSLLISEQAAPTAALSSGVALLFGFMLLSGKEWGRSP